MPALGRRSRCPSPAPCSAPRRNNSTPPDAIAVGGWLNPIPDAACLSGASLIGNAANTSIAYAFPRLTPGTYQIAIAWQAKNYTQGSQAYAPSTATQVVVTDLNGATLAIYSVNQSIAPGRLRGQRRRIQDPRLDHPPRPRATR